MIAHSVTQIANGTRRFRCMFAKRGEVFYTIEKTSRAMRRAGLPVRSPKDVVPTNHLREAPTSPLHLCTARPQEKAPPESGAQFGRSIVMGLPGRWQKISDTVLARAGGRRG